MRWFKKIAFVLSLIFMLVMAMNFRSVDRVWDKWLKGSNQVYYGNINLWHINDDFNVKLPYASIFKKYEKDNFGVFINVSYFNQEEARLKMEQGEKPDLITYSKNCFNDAEKELVALDKLDTGFKDNGQKGGKQLAYLMCYDSYTLVMNDELIYEAVDDIPSIIEPVYIANKLIREPYKEGVIGLGFTKYGGAISFLDGLGRSDIDIPYQEVTLQDFEKGKVAVMVCGNIELERYGGELPSYTEYGFSRFSDRGRYISVVKGDDKNRVECCKEIAELVMSDGAQKKISEYGFSAVYGYLGENINKDINLVNVFDDFFSKEQVQRDMVENREKLLNTIKDMKK